MRFYILLIGTMSLGQASWAASPFKQALTMKVNSYLTDGVFIGGTAGTGASILGVRRVYSKRAKIERVIVDVGDKDARPSGLKMSYFQASVDAKQNRVILDVTQLKYSKVSEQHLRELFHHSPYVSAVDFTTDPEDRTGTMVLKLKRPMRLEVFELLDKKKSARVVLDLTPAKTMQLRD